MTDTPGIFHKGLNEPQKKAASTLDGPLLILAGAGSGKTRVLTYRIANLIASKSASPHQILAVTFTNKAAKEMQERTLGLLTEFGMQLSEPPWISTFHSIGARILRDNIKRLGFETYFSILDQSDQLATVKRVVQSLGLNDKIYPPKRIQHDINEAKMFALKPHEVETSYLAWDDKTIQIYELYEAELKKSNAVDFSDLLFKTLILFREHPDVLETYKEMFKYIMVDEYQDTNHIQYLILKLLSEDHRNICVVGDEDQSIYSWRGADIRNILDFEKDFPEAVTVKLEENYRSTQTIVNAASAVIANNTERKDKTLFSNAPEGDKITVREEASEYDEAKFVVKEIKTLMKNYDLAYKEHAVFYRTNAQSRVLEEELRSNKIPYKIIGGIKFYERKEIKDILCYLRLILNPTDNIAFLRVLNTPTRGIGKTTVTRLQETAQRQDISIVEAALYCVKEKVVNAGTAKKITGFLNLLSTLRDSAKDLGVSEIYHLVLDETGYVQKLKEEDTYEADARIENLEEFDNAIVQFEKERGDEATLQFFLEEMALVSEADNVDDEEDSVILMTLHISKGLEYPHVFIVGMEDNLFPGARAMDALDPSEIEEERRLCYVGMTRAEKKLYLTYARRRKVWGMDQHNPPSKFLGEIPKKYIEGTTSVVAPRFMDRYKTSRDSANGSSKPMTFSERVKERNKKKNGAASAPVSWDENQYDQMPDYENEVQDPSKTGFTKGSRVRHPTFGVGTIYKADGTGETQKVTILFEDNSIRKFVIKYARLTPV